MFALHFTHSSAVLNMFETSELCTFKRGGGRTGAGCEAHTSRQAPVGLVRCENFQKSSSLKVDPH